MNYLDPNLMEEDDELNDGPAPADTLAGPQTPRGAVMQRIASKWAGNDPTDDNYSSKDLGALQYMQNNAQVAGIGRALNALAAGTGVKTDNSGLDALQKQGSDLAEKQLSRSAAIQKAIEDRRLKAEIADQTNAYRANKLDQDAKLAQQKSEDRRYMAEVMGGARGEGLDLKKDEQAARAADRIHKDPIIQRTQKQGSVLDRGLNILKKPGLTNQEFNDVQMELSNAIAGGNSSAMGKLTRTEYHTLGQNLGELMQKVTGKPQESAPPELVERVKALMQEMRGTIGREAFERANGLKRNYGHNQAANDEQEKAIQVYNYQPPENETQAGKNQSGSFINEARAGSGRVNVTNGKETYSIPLTRLPDALKDGFKVVK
jgi:hypothetical protein